MCARRYDRQGVEHDGQAGALVWGEVEHGGSGCPTFPALCVVETAAGGSSPHNSVASPPLTGSQPTDKRNITDVENEAYRE